MRKHLFITLFLFLNHLCYSQQGVLTLGIQYKPIFSSQFFDAGPVESTNEYFYAKRTPKLGFSFGMQLRRGISRSFSYETGINYVKRNYYVDCTDENAGSSEKFDFSLIGYEIPNQILIYIRLGENFYMNTATGISLNWFASDVASISSSTKFFQKTYLAPAWMKIALIANLGFEYRSKKSGTFYLGASLTRTFGDIGTTIVTYDESLTTPDKEILFPLKGSIFTVDLRYFFHSDPVKQKVNDTKK